jgi:hypothetical protein
MKFKFLSAALAGLFLSFSSVVDAAPVRYDYIGGSVSSGIAVTGYVVLGNGVTASGVNAIGSITDWSFDWTVAGSSFSRGFGDGALAGVATKFILGVGAQVASATFCVIFETGECSLPTIEGGGPASYLLFGDLGANEVYFRLNSTVPTGIFSGFSGKWSGPVAVPEPSSLAIFALGIMGLALRRFKKQS